MKVNNLNNSTMKQRYSLKSNAVKFRLLTLTLLALLVGGNMAWGQESRPWTPSSEGTYRLRSRTGDNNFDVYKDGTASAVATNRTSIGSFGIASGTYRIIFENTKTIDMTGQIYIDANDGTQAHLIMELGEAPRQANPIQDASIASLQILPPTSKRRMPPASPPSPSTSPQKSTVSP